MTVGTQSLVNYLALFHCCWVGGVLVTIAHHLVLCGEHYFQQIDHGGVLGNGLRFVSSSIVIAISLLLHCLFILCIHPCCCLGQVLLQAHSSEPDLMGI